MPAPASRLRLALEHLALAALASLAYANTLHNEPVLDDGWVIFENPLIKHLADVPRLFREPYNAAGASTVAGLFRPFTSLTYALNYAAGGAEVLGYHLVNLLLHVACTALVLALVRRLAQAASPARANVIALGAAALFAVHPAHVEAVAGMVGRAEELAALGALGALVLLLGGRTPLRMLGAFGALALGVLSKESSAVAAPLLALVGWLVPSALGLDAAPGLRTPAARRSLKALAIAEVPLVLAIAVYPALVLAGPGHLGVPASAAWFGTRPESVVLLTMTRALAEYFRILVWPHPLGVDFYYAQQIPFTAGLGAPSVLATLVWGALLAGALGVRRRRPLEALGILWVFAALLPVLNLVRIGTLMGERLLYLPSVGFCLAVASLGSELLAPRRWLAPAALGAAVVVLLGLTWRRNAEWRDSLTLWEAELAKEPTDVVVNNNLAVEYQSRGDDLRAKERLQVALKTAPFYWRAWVNLGIAEHHLHQDADALAALDRARQIDPTASSPELFTGLVHYDRKELAQAVTAFAEAARKAPLDAQAHYWYGRALLESGRKTEALPVLARAVQLDPGNRWARQLLDQASR